MISRTVVGTKWQMHKVHEKVNADELQFHYSDTNEGVIKFLFGLMYFRGLYHETKQPTKEISHAYFPGRSFYTAGKSLSRYEWLMRTITFHDYSSVRADLLDDSFACMKWLLTKFESNARRIGCHR